MSEFTIQMIQMTAILCAGLIIGSYITAKILAFKTRKKRHAREQALQDIASFQWNASEYNDAMIITRMALKGLDGEEQ